MNVRPHFAVALSLLFLGAGCPPWPWTTTVVSPAPINVEYPADSFAVTHVVDGDTFDVDMNGATVRVRIIGMNTPETVDPRKPVECFGKEASDRAKALLTDQRVRLEVDATQDDRDKYDRSLRHVFLADGTNFALAMIRDGYAYEYTYDAAYKYQKEYKAAQEEAKSAKRGLWADGACGQKAAAKAPAPAPTEPTAPAPTPYTPPANTPPSSDPTMTWELHPVPAPSSP